MSGFLSALKEADVDNLHKQLNHGDKRYLCFTKVTQGGKWRVLVSDGIDVWMQEYDEDSLEALRDVGGINSMDAYLNKFR